MPKVYQVLVLNGKRTWDKVPDNLKQEVKDLLKQDVINGDISAEQFEKIVGEKYVP